MLNKKTKQLLVSYSFIAPNLIGFLIFSLIPIIFSFVLAFSKFDNLNGLSFIGFKNFIKMANDTTLKISLINTMYYTIFTVPLTIIASLGLAVLLNNKVPGIKYLRLGIFFPYITSIVAVGVVWNMLYHPTEGVINSVISFFGVKNLPGWTSNKYWAMPAIIITSVWKNMGYYMVIFLAGLQAIPRELYEAAKVDGTNCWERFRFITVPSLSSSIFFVGIMTTISCFKVFDLILIMTEGGPGRSTNVLVYKIYNEAFVNMNYGYASAIALLLLLIVLIITFIQFRLEKKFVTY